MTSTRYNTIAVTLHWLIAFAIFALLISGLVIHQEWLPSQSLQFALFQWHKSLGVVVLVSVVLRVLWRLTHAAPALPASFSNVELGAAKAGHLALYALLLLMPFSGWLLVSGSETGIPTIVFNLFSWPHIPIAKGGIFYRLAANAHHYGAIAIALVIIGHIGVVIKHQKDNINILERMPFKGAGVSAITVLIVALVILTATSIFGVSSSQPSVSDSSQGSIEFRGMHAGDEFVGIFKEWSLQTDLNMSAGTMSEFVLSVGTASTDTGNPFYDQTLVEEDWFNPEVFPQASYTASGIQKMDDQTVLLQGEFTIKDVVKPLDITIQATGDDQITTSFSVSRLGYTLGVGADPSADWVDDEIRVTATASLQTINP